MIARARELIDRAKALAPTAMAWRQVRAAVRYGRLRGNRLAGAVSFYGFVSLFPLLALASAIAVRVVGDQGVATLQTIVDENLPGLELDVSIFAAQAGTIGLIGGIALLWTGLLWVDATRASVRSMWELDDAPGNFVVRKLVDLAVLIGLGAIILISFAATAMVDAVADHVLEWLGIDGGFAAFGSRALALTLAITSSSVLFGYLLAGLPRIPIPPKVLLVAALVGGLAYEVLKQLVTQFAILVTPNTTYAIFAVPLALLAWIYLVTRLLMSLAAATAEWRLDDPTEAPATAPASP